MVVGFRLGQAHAAVLHVAGRVRLVVEEHENRVAPGEDEGAVVGSGMHLQRRCGRNRRTNLVERLHEAEPLPFRVEAILPERAPDRREQGLGAVVDNRHALRQHGPSHGVGDPAFVLIADAGDARGVVVVDKVTEPLHTSVRCLQLLLHAGTQKGEVPLREGPPLSAEACDRRVVQRKIQHAVQDGSPGRPRRVALELRVERQIRGRDLTENGDVRRLLQV
mmetsp:Transcript_103414/g.297061  ORF Transcript_103414/g.297061 Transcript_103414/m.297061 type:complete len:221 (+) Transcript_103414:221-883(+)